MLDSQNKILIPFSHGDCLDRLCILYLKREYNNDNDKAIYIEREIKEIQEACNGIILTDLSESFYSRKLYDTNRKMYNIQDELHEHGISPQKEHQLMKMLNDENDRRSRLKVKINSGQYLKEIKTYKNSICILLGHNGLGDHIFCIGMIRYFSASFDQVDVVCFPHNLNTLKQLFADDINIRFLPTESESPLVNITNQEVAEAKWRETTSKYTYAMRLGFHSFQHFNLSDFPLCFYIQAGINVKIIRDWFHVCNVKDTILPSHSRFQFVHSVSSSKTASIPDDIILLNVFIIDPDKNHYHPEHLFHAEAQKFIGLPFHMYVEVIRRAERIVAIDSSFFCLALMINNEAIHTCFSRDGRSYDNISTKPLKYVKI